MKVELTQGSVASQSDIATLQQAIGEPLIPEFLEFVENNDGAEPDSNTFEVGTTNSAGISAFIPVKDIVEEMSYMENLPDRSYPVAWASGGNYVFINQAEGGAVFFWDHELPEDLTKVADDFRSFLELLEPFDMGSITLEPGQVESVWINPDFLKKLGNN